MYSPRSWFSGIRIFLARIAIERLRWMICWTFIHVSIAQCEASQSSYGLEERYFFLMVLSLARVFLHCLGVCIQISCESGSLNLAVVPDSSQILFWLIFLEYFP